MISLDKPLTLSAARKLSEQFCKHFMLPYCEIYYVDRLSDIGPIVWKRSNIHNAWASYIRIDKDIGIVLMVEKIISQAAILTHELAHHLELCAYVGNYSEHGYTFQLAKRKVLAWAQKYVSDSYDWRIALKAKIEFEDLEAFQQQKKKGEY